MSELPGFLSGFPSGLAEAQLQLLEPPPQAAPDHPALGVSELTFQVAAGCSDALTSQESPGAAFVAHPRPRSVAVVAEYLSQNWVKDFEIQ